MVHHGLRCCAQRGKGDCLDAYLDIALSILRSERRPLSPKAILAVAYKHDCVPNYLYGRTQHKTLQARISEDIVLQRDRSAFFRTAPGRFFLREFLADESIPEEHRRPVPTRRRFRELVRGPVLALERKALEHVTHSEGALDPKTVFGLLKADKFRYDDPRNKNPDSVFFRSFVCVQRDSMMLSYRIGRYREDRDSFMSKRSIGFSTFVHADECTLFNYRTFGIIDAGVQATKVDLDVPDIPASLSEEPIKANLTRFLWSHNPGGSDDILAVVLFECPRWFEPVTRRLALNDLRWIDRKHVNNIEDFDPWSRIVLSHQSGCTIEQSHQLGHATTPYRRLHSDISEGPSRDLRSRTDQERPSATLQAVPTRRPFKAEPP